MLSGSATDVGTARYAARFSHALNNGFYRQSQEWTVSSLGLGTYLGSLDQATDLAYRDAITAAVCAGINFIDTSLNYRHQRSELAVGEAIELLVHSGDYTRAELVVSTKAGYLVPGAVPAGLKPADIVGGMHSMAPLFLVDQIARSRVNLRLETIDVFYLHNPETQLDYVAPDEFYRRMLEAFRALELEAASGSIRYYGTATWEGYRRPAQAFNRISLMRVVELAREAGGANHHFRFLQLPFNLSMTEAFLERPERLDGAAMSVLEAAAMHGVSVIGSATLLQARLSRNLPAELAERLPGAATDAQRAIQFARSAPGLSVALVGMSKAEHVADNAAVAGFPPLPPEEYQRLYRTS